MEGRKPDYPIDKIFIQRWSPRAMSGESMSNDELMSLFEAARWAPSSYNNQPWRFVYAKRETPAWNTLFNLLAPANQQWAKNAAVLLVVVSHNTFDYNGNVALTHSFDTGAAWENLALQASLKGLIAHGMQGFDYDRAKKELVIPDGYTVEAMVAIGYPGKKEDLPPELQKNEHPSDRNKVETFVFEGKWR
jgi:nitroreductase